MRAAGEPGLEERVVYRVGVWAGEAVVEDAVVDVEGQEGMGLVEGDLVVLHLACMLPFESVRFPYTG